MNTGDRVRITPQAWAKYLKEHGAPAGQKFNSDPQEVRDLQADRVLLAAYPGFWWREEDLTLAEKTGGEFILDSEPVYSEEALTRAFCAAADMWGRRYAYNTDNLASPQEGSEFPGPVVVDLGQLAILHSELLSLIQQVRPDLYQSLFKDGGVPDAPLPVPNPKVFNLDDVRIRAEGEFADEQIAYVEALWGKKTYAFNAAIRDLEAMRRGRDNGALRRPETYHEGQLLVYHVRALANDLARNFGMDHLIREGDDLEKKVKT